MANKSGYFWNIFSKSDKTLVENQDSSEKYDISFLADPNFDIYLQDNLLTEKKLNGKEFQWVKRPSGFFTRLGFWFMHSAYVSADRVCDALATRLNHGDYTQFNEADFDQLEKNLEKLKDKFTHKQGAVSKSPFSLGVARFAIKEINRTLSIAKRVRKDQIFSNANGLKNSEGINLQAGFKKFNVSLFKSSKVADDFFQKHIIKKSLTDEFEFKEKPRSITSKFIHWLTYGAAFRKDRLAESLAIRIHHGDYKDFSANDFDQMIQSINGNGSTITGIRERLTKKESRGYIKTETQKYVDKALDEAVSFLEEQKRHKQTIVVINGVHEGINNVKDLCDQLLINMKQHVAGTNVTEQTIANSNLEIKDSTKEVESQFSLFDHIKGLFSVKNDEEDHSKQHKPSSEEVINQSRASSVTISPLAQFSEWLESIANGTKTPKEPPGMNIETPVENIQNDVSVDANFNSQNPLITPVTLQPRYEPRYEEVDAPYDLREVALTDEEVLGYDPNQYEEIFVEEVEESMIVQHKHSFAKASNVLKDSIPIIPETPLQEHQPLYNEDSANESKNLSSESILFSRARKALLTCFNDEKTQFRPGFFQPNPATNSNAHQQDEADLKMQLEQYTYELRNVESFLKPTSSSTESEVNIIEFYKELELQKTELLSKINTINERLEYIHSQQSDVTVDPNQQDNGIIYSLTRYFSS